MVYKEKDMAQNDAAIKHASSSDESISDRLWFLSGSVCSQELDSTCLVGPFQFRKFCDSMIPSSTAVSKKSHFTLLQGQQVGT